MAYVENDGDIFSEGWKSAPANVCQETGGDAKGLAQWSAGTQRPKTRTGAMVRRDTKGELDPRESWKKERWALKKSSRHGSLDLSSLEVSCRPPHTIFAISGDVF